MSAISQSTVNEVIRPNRGTRSAIVIGFALAAVGCAALVFVKASWEYVAFILPLVVIAVGLGLANGPASSASTASVDQEKVGQASGISNMARYIGGSVAVAAVATVFNAVTNNHLHSGASDADALAAGLAGAALLLAIFSAAGVALSLLVARHRPEQPQAIHRAAAAAAHTIPTRPPPGPTASGSVGSDGAATGHRPIVRAKGRKRERTSHARQ